MRAGGVLYIMHTPVSLQMTDFLPCHACGSPATLIVSNWGDMHHNPNDGLVPHGQVRDKGFKIFFSTESQIRSPSRILTYRH